MLDSIGFSIILLSGFWGLWTGGVKQACKLLLLVITVSLVSFAFPLLRTFGKKYFAEGVLLDVLSGVVSYICAVLVTLLLESYFPYPQPSALDRVAGLLIGIVKGIAVCAIFLMFGMILSTGSYAGSESALEILDKTLSCPKPQWYQSSLLAKLLSKLLSTFYSALGPEVVRAKLAKIRISFFNKDA